MNETCVPGSGVPEAARNRAPFGERSAIRRGERGATVVSTLLLVVAMSTVGLLAMRNTSREMVQSGQLVARERALMVAQAAVSLAGSQYAAVYAGDGGVMGESPGLNQALAGQSTPGCDRDCGDCIPGSAVGSHYTETGQRNRILATADVDCGGRPCMRQGAVAFLPMQGGAAAADEWCNRPFRAIVPGGDPEATVSVWIRNNAADAFDTATAGGDWTVDQDATIVVTASATVRNTTVTVEEELLLQTGEGTSAWQPQSADRGYGAGHNNDNTTGSRCRESNPAEGEGG